MRGKIGVEIRRILRSAPAEVELPRRIVLISERFLGRPYVVNSLGGGAGLPERLTVKLDAFDCVTYLETVLALALSASAGEFEANLRRIRYRGGELSWPSRNHYLVDWWRNNEKLGLVKNLTRGGETVEKARALNVVKGLPEKRVTFRVFPKRRSNRLAERCESGDLICFASAKKNLDVFHTGFLIRHGDDVLLRHASRTVGEVVDQSLKGFLQKNRMSGFVWLRASTT